MIQATRLAYYAALRLRTPSQSPWHLPHVAWASSLSAIHRGIHRGNRSSEQDLNGRLGFKKQPTTKWRPKSEQGRGFQGRRGFKKMLKARRKARNRKAKSRPPAPTFSTQPLSAQDVHNAIAGDPAEPPPRQTRRKRFIDPNSSFGKKSHVYRVKFGDLKEKADAILARERREQARLLRTAWKSGEGRSGEPQRTDAGRQLREETSRGEDRGGAPFEERLRTREGGSFERGQEAGSAERGQEGAPRGRERYDPPSERRGREGAPGGRVRGGAPTDRRGREGTPSWERLREAAFDVGAGRPRPRPDEMGSEKPRPAKRGEPISLARATAASQFLFGTAVINAALASHRRKLYRLYVLNTGKRAQQIEDQRNNPQILAKQRGVPITFVEQRRGAMLDKMSGGRPHNGYILEASPLPQLPVTALAPWSPPNPNPAIEVVLGRQSKEEEAINGRDPSVPYRRNKQQKPFVVLLHEVVDPGNLGAMIRSAVFLGANAVAITAGGSATLTPVAGKAAAGAAEEIPIFIVNSDLEFITASKKAGWRFYAAAPPSLQKDPRKTTAAKVEKENPLADAPCVLVLGSEGKGLPKTVRRAVNFEISIPGAPKTSVDSLNVSVAGGILCNAFLNPFTAQVDEEASSQEALSSEESTETTAEEQSDQAMSSEEEAEEKQAADGEERIF